MQVQCDLTATFINSSIAQLSTRQLYKTRMLANAQPDGRPMYNEADHIYFHPVSSFFLFFPRLISAVGDWMSAILPHMVWP